MVGPDSSYSPLEIHICWNVLKEDKIEPPIQTEYLRSGGATTLIFMVDGAKAVTTKLGPQNVPVLIMTTEDALSAFGVLGLGVCRLMQASTVRLLLEASR